MNCPECEHEYTKVKETRLVVGFPRWTKRRRVCPQCNNQFWSVELPTADLDNLQGEEHEPSDD
jgi:transcriptional regulator NrdR family protein